MTDFSVKNPTPKKKAVRAAGGILVINPGKSEKVSEDWSEGDVAKYEAAGLEVKESKSSTKKSE